MLECAQLDDWTLPPPNFALPTGNLHETRGCVFAINPERPKLGYAIAFNCRSLSKPLFDLPFRRTGVGLKVARERIPPLQPLSVHLSR